MKTYIYILFLLAAIVQPLLAQDAPATKAQPPFPTLPSTVTYNAAPTGGTVALFVPGAPHPVEVAPGGKIHPGVEVTLTITPETNNKVVFGSLKVYCTKATAKILELKTVSGKPNEYTFTMPKEPVTVEVKFEEKLAPSSDARLKALRYKIGSSQPEEWIPVPDFTPGTKEYTVTLPTNTTDGTTIKLSGTAADAYATLNESQATATLSSGTGSATLTVTAEDNATTANYTVNFVKAEADKYIVTIASVDGGTITVTDATGKVINSGDVVATGTQLTLTNMPVAGYTFSKYIVGSSDHTGTTVTVENSDVKISAEFTPPTAPIQPETIGTPAVTDEKPPVPAQDAAVVIVPDAGSLPEDTELWELRLVKEDVDESKKDEVKNKAETAAGQANIEIDKDKMVLMEVTLVKVTTTTNPSNGESTTTVTPVQPTDKVKVRIPYPAGVNKNSHDITIIHLKSDGGTEVYSGGDLTLADDYMEITVTGFSPFVVAYVDKPKDPDPGPDPGPKPDPTYYTVTLPAVEGAITDPAPGNYEVVAWDSFTFYLTLDKDYDQSVPIVTTDRNETITPRTSDGAYLVKRVRSAITISIAGIKKNTDVANETIASGLKIWTEPSALCLDTDRTEEVRIITVAGSTAAVFTTQPGLNRRPLAPGLYIVQTARKVSKVIVR